MNLKTSLKRLGVFSVALASIFGTSLTLPLAVSADNINFTLDNFNHLYLKPDARAQWWIINWGPGPGYQDRVEDYCGPTSCVTEIKDQVNHFARLSTHTAPAGYFTNAELAEIHTGFPSEGQGHWTPSVGQPVTLVTNVRWSSNYAQDGSGGAVGTNGVWLWNSPYDLQNYDPTASVTALGFNWAPSNAAGGFLAGLKVNVFDQNIPYFINRPLQTVNMQDWVEFKLVWSVDGSGTQNVKFYINSENVGDFNLPRAFSNLSLEAWNDNEDPQFDQTGLHINYAAIPSEQNFDISSISLRK